MEIDFKTIGIVEMNVMPYLEKTVPKKNIETLRKLLNEHTIKDEDLEQMLIHENDNERLFTIQVKGFEEDLYFRVAKEAQ